MQDCFIFLLDFNDFNEICTPNQRVPPLIIFKDWAGTLQATQADLEMDSESERCQIWTNLTWNWSSGVLSGHSPIYLPNSKRIIAEHAVFQNNQRGDPLILGYILHWNHWNALREWSKLAFSENFDLESWNRENLEMIKGGTLWVWIVFSLKS